MWLFQFIFFPGPWNEKPKSVTLVHIMASEQAALLLRKQLKGIIFSSILYWKNYFFLSIKTFQSVL